MPREEFLSAVYMIIKNDKQEVLFQRRIGSKLWSNFLGLPAGHIDKGENAVEALIREAKEELDIDITSTNIEDTFVVNRRNKNLKPYYDVYFLLKSYNGKIKINEPNKCQELKWLKLETLPDDVIGFEKVALENYLRGIKFSVIDIDEEEDMKRIFHTVKV